MYVKVTDDNTIDTYPYGLSELRNEYPNTSFPKNSAMTDEFLAQYNIYRVVEAEHVNFNEKTHDFTWNDQPTLVDGVWTLLYNITEKDEDSLNQVSLRLEDENRMTRDDGLAATDWYVVKAQETGTEVPANVVTYRQALRDLTDHPNWPDLNADDWPILE